MFVAPFPAASETHSAYWEGTDHAFIVLERDVPVSIPRLPETFGRSPYEDTGSVRAAASASASALSNATTDGDGSSDTTKKQQITLTPISRRYDAESSPANAAVSSHNKSPFGIREHLSDRQKASNNVRSDLIIDSPSKMIFCIETACKLIECSWQVFFLISLVINNITINNSVSISDAHS